MAEQDQEILEAIGARLKDVEPKEHGHEHHQWRPDEIAHEHGAAGPQQRTTNAPSSALWPSNSPLGRRP
jgi:hypothetical protein